MSSRSDRTYLLCLVLIASLGGFLFGYDTAVISGTIGFVKEKFALDAVMEGWYVSSALVGCLAGVATAGFLSDRFGRKRILLLSAFLFSVSGIGCAAAASHSALTAYRLVGGLGIGVASMLSPLYISEIAPPMIRGRMVALYQFAITIGILSSYFVNAGLLHIAQTSPAAGSGWMHHIFVAEVWRGMLGSATVPALLFFLLLLFVPESPRWLVARGQDTRALQILIRIEGAELAGREIKEIKEAVSRESESLGTIFEPGIRFALLLGVALAFLTQVSGINAVIYYGPRILEDAGFTLGDALGGQVVIGIVNVVFTLVAIWKIDDLGRRPLLIFGVSGIVASLVAIGFLFKFNVTSGLWLMAFILLYIACFAFSFGPVIWVLLSEMYPTRIRGRAMSIAILSLWAGTALIGQTVPWMLDNLQPSGTFWLFALLCSPAIYLAWKVLPETKGKTLEEIEHYWLSLAEEHGASATSPR